MSVLIHERRAASQGAATALPEPPLDAAVIPDAPADCDEIDDTQPSIVLPDADEEFWDAPTVPGFHLRAGGSVERDLVEQGAAADGQWDKVLRAVAVAVRRVFASHSIGRLS